MSQTKAQLIDAVDGSIVSADIADQAVTSFIYEFPLLPS